jgi:predicted O-methyltransferase YrrM
MPKDGTSENRVARTAWLYRRLPDVLMAVPSTLAAALGAVYAARPHRFPLTGRVWDAAGVLPVPYHYYQPIYLPDQMPSSVWADEDPLEGIAQGVERQLELLQRIGGFAPELAAVPDEKPSALGYYFANLAFGPGSAEVLYGMVRLLQPRTVIEVGSGMSTLMARMGLAANARDGQEGRLISVEPYSAPWLEGLGDVTVLRQRVEELDVQTFATLGANDILFIDSSHVLRPGGDVRYLYGRVVPLLAPGVVVHVHDVYLPWEYPREWAQQSRHFWNEQYVLQAFLSHNPDFEVLLASHYLERRHRDAMEAACPSLRRFPERTTSSFWFCRKVLAGTASAGLGPGPARETT